MAIIDAPFSCILHFHKHFLSPGYIRGFRTYQMPTVDSELPLIIHLHILTCDRQSPTFSLYTTLIGGEQKENRGSINTGNIHYFARRQDSVNHGVFAFIIECLPDSTLYFAVF